MIIKYICEYCLEEYDDVSGIYTCDECGTEICEYCSDGLSDELCFDCAKSKDINLNKED